MFGKLRPIMSNAVASLQTFSEVPKHSKESASVRIRMAPTTSRSMRCEIMGAAAGWGTEYIAILETSSRRERWSASRRDECRSSIPSRLDTISS